MFHVIAYSLILRLIYSIMNRKFTYRGCKTKNDLKKKWCPAKASLPPHPPLGQASPPPNPNRSHCPCCGALPKLHKQKGVRVPSPSLGAHAAHHSAGSAFHCWRSFHSITCRTSLFQVHSRKKKNTTSASVNSDERTDSVACSPLESCSHTSTKKHDC